MNLAAQENPYDLGDDRGLGPLIALAGRLSSKAREKRYREYREIMRPAAGDRILDLGCGGYWSLAHLDPKAHITGVDLVERPGFDRPNQRFVRTDACALPFEDQSFEIAYANSLVEHIAPARRQAFADEVRRVARRYWVQTPHYWFPVEPHALLPGVQFLPAAARRALWRASPRGVEYEESLRLLTVRELRSLFGDALILRERVGPLTKSLVAVGPRDRFGDLASRSGKGLAF